MAIFICNLLVSRTFHIMPFEIYSSILIKKEKDLSPTELNTIKNAKIPISNTIFLIDKSGKLPVTLLTGSSAFYFEELLENYELYRTHSEDDFLELIPESLKTIHKKLVTKRIVVRKGILRHALENSEDYSVKYDVWNEGQLFYKKALSDNLSNRLKNEARSLKYMHENNAGISPKFISYDAIEGILCCEYIEGYTLPSLSDKSIQERYDISEEIIKNYQKLHAIGLLHGDVSINNIIVDAVGNVFLIDFEWARLHSNIKNLEIEVAREENPVATLYYCSPDVANAWLRKKLLKKTIHSELYSIAALIYHFLMKTPLVDPLEHLVQKEYLNNIAAGPSTFNLEKLEQLSNRSVAKWIRSNLMQTFS
ncbi:protein kinase domain-containing protein [Chromobacterium violaceum]|uniref:protein kinase domain-containing protein n=1 Tax=Chromobacterium violaceum TaxID=536 RepID=UPI001C8B3649|nr:serine/threonine-protein kinase [Chromobacterium violaceum]MBX9268993.1 hypothetical protein [Chromobacterium violaceum]